MFAILAFATVIGMIISMGVALAKMGIAVISHCMQGNGITMQALHKLTYIAPVSYLKDDEHDLYQECMNRIGQLTQSYDENSLVCVQLKK